MKTKPRNPVARAMRLAGKSTAVHGRSARQERRRETRVLRRALREGKEIFRGDRRAAAAKNLFAARNLEFC